MSPDLMTVGDLLPVTEIKIKSWQPSRLLSEIPGDLLNQWNLRPSNSYQ